MPVKSAPVPTAGLSAGNKALDPVVQYDGVIFASAARTVASSPYNSAEMNASGWLGVKLYINVSNANGGTLTVKVQNFDPASQTWIDLALATTAGLTGTQAYELVVYPGNVETAGTATTSSIIDQVLPVRWRVVATVGTATMTFSIGADYLR
jgi:hypothetical protein